MITLNAMTASLGKRDVSPTEPMIEQVLADIEQRVPVERIARKFHNTLVEVIIEMAHRVEQEVVLTGGCFQNKYLLNEPLNGWKLKVSALLASACPAQRWRDCPGPGVCCSPGKVQGRAKIADGVALPV